MPNDFVLQKTTPPRCNANCSAGSAYVSFPPLFPLPSGEPEPLPPVDLLPENAYDILYPNPQTYRQKLLPAASALVTLETPVRVEFVQTNHDQVTEAVCAEVETVVGVGRQLQEGFVQDDTTSANVGAGTSTATASTTTTTEMQITTTTTTTTTTTASTTLPQRLAGIVKASCHDGVLQVRGTCGHACNSPGGVRVAGGSALHPPMRHGQLSSSVCPYPATGSVAVACWHAVAHLMPGSACRRPCPSPRAGRAGFEDELADSSVNDFPCEEGFAGGPEQWICLDGHLTQTRTCSRRCPQGVTLNLGGRGSRQAFVFDVNLGVGEERRLECPEETSTGTMLVRCNIDGNIEHVGEEVPEPAESDDTNDVASNFDTSAGGPGSNTLTFEEAEAARIQQLIAADPENAAKYDDFEFVLATAVVYSPDRSDADIVSRGIPAATRSRARPVTSTARLVSLRATVPF